MATKSCTHVDILGPVIPTSFACEDCIQAGAAWHQLRLCLSCGYVGCDDRSKNQHALRHYQDTHHPVVQSFEAGEDWRWCYVDQIYT